LLGAVMISLTVLSRRLGFSRSDEILFAGHPLGLSRSCCSIRCN
jgi:hypothetical protein